MAAGTTETSSTLQQVRTVCAHDCPDACSILVTLDAGRVVRTDGDLEHPFTQGFLCGKVNRYAERVYAPDRLLTPLRRVGAKGEGRFEPITWAAALDDMVARWQAIAAQYGSEAIAGYAYSAHQGLVNRNLTQALFHALGATRVNAGAVCDTCNGEAWEAVVGTAMGTDPERVSDADLIISWGANLDSTNVHLLPLIHQARERGARLIVIDVWRTRTARHADWFVPIRVGTDTALALGMAHVLQREGLTDQAYIDRLVAGYDAWSRDVLPRYTPEVASDITGIAASDIETLAVAYGRAKAPFIRMGQGLSRHAGGGTAVRAIACLPGLVGAWQYPGGGALLATTGAYNFNFAAVRRPDLLPQPTRTLNMVRFGEALQTWQEPPLKALFIQSNNPAVTCPEQNLVRQGLMREDLYTVVHDTFLSDTARYADIVLPACTSFETEDMYRGYGTYYVQYGARVLPPQGESRSNEEVIRALAERLDLQDPVFRRSVREHIAALLDVDSGPIAGLSLDMLLDGRPHRLDVPAMGHLFDRHFPTPSGKLRIACPELAPVLPDYIPDAAEPAAAYPLRLVSAPGHHLHHSSFDGVASLRRSEGGPWVYLHPEEAKARGIAHGQAVELVNERGGVGLYANVTTDAPLGCAVVEGHRPQSEYLSGGPLNRLCSDRLTDVGEGATYQNTWLDVRPLDVLLDVTQAS